MSEREEGKRERSTRRRRSRSPQRKIKKEEDTAYDHIKHKQKPDSYRERAPKVKREKDDEEEEEKKPNPEDLKEPEKPNFNQSGKLAKDTNTINGVIVKYNEPEDASMPGKNLDYKLFIFEKDDIVDTISLNQKSWYLLGRDKKVCHVLLEGKSISKQHAVIQFRQISSRDKYGDVKYTIKPYLIDLESSYGTKLNGNDIPSSRFVELKTQDLIQFAGTLREYVVMKDDDE